MKLCIAEKPSVAKEIASILQANSRRDGYFEGNGYCVSWTFGHLCTLKEPHDYDPRLKRWTLEDLPIVPPKYGIKLITNQGVEKQFKIIESLVQQADEVINCGDAGQEGELIQRWVLAKAGCNKPMKRLWISSLTEEAIREGFNKLRPSSEFDNLYASGSMRAIGDWLLGINTTRLYTLRFGGGKQVLSIGRVQTPTLALVVNRQKTIENFKPENYWELKTKYREAVFTAVQGRFTNKQKAEESLQKIINELFEIKDVTIKKSNEAPPRLFDLTGLQVECNKRFGYSADDTLKTIQSLYEKKLTTYPRVDTTYLPDDIYPKCQGILGGLKGYEQFTSPLLNAPLRKSKKVFNNDKVTDHHAIIPTGVAADSMSVYESNVYQLVTKRFIASFYPDSEVSNTTVIGAAAQIDFKATGKQILSPGWRTVLGKEADEKKDENEQSLPIFEKGESGEHQAFVDEKQTQPPQYYTEASLLRAMETAGRQIEDEELKDLMKENGIGRPSTRANIIETLFKRNYMVRDKKKILATATGVQLIDTIQNELLKSAELTGQWEKKLREIERGTFDPQQFKHELTNMVAQLVHEVKSLLYVVPIELIDNNTPKPVAVSRKSNVSSAPKETKKDSKKETKREPKKAATEDVAKKTAIPSVAINLGDLKCPKCKKGFMLKGKTAWGCSEWKQGCDFRVMFEANGTLLSDKHLQELLINNQVKVVSKQSKQFMTLYLNSDFILNMK